MRTKTMSAVTSCTPTVDTRVHPTQTPRQARASTKQAVVTGQQRRGEGALRRRAAQGS